MNVVYTQADVRQKYANFLIYKQITSLFQHSIRIVFALVPVLRADSLGII